MSRFQKWWTSKSRANDIPDDLDFLRSDSIEDLTQTNKTLTELSRPITTSGF